MYRRAATLLAAAGWTERYWQATRASVESTRAQLAAVMSSFGGQQREQGGRGARPVHTQSNRGGHGASTASGRRGGGTGQQQGRSGAGRGAGRSFGGSRQPTAGTSQQQHIPTQQAGFSTHAGQPMQHAREPHRVAVPHHKPRHHQHQEAPLAAPAPIINNQALTGVLFSSLRLHPLTLSALHDVFGYQEMFKVQAAACPPALQGHDVLAKAKTGTGKTLAFLVPIAERLAAGPPTPIGGAIRSLIMAPTRELAAQTKAEAVKLLQPHGANAGVQMVIGGTNINRERNGLNNTRCDVLIATPGRLQDHIDSTPGFEGRLWGVQVLVLDEVDRLLDMGFRPAIEAIMKSLPPPGQRQALMYSATLPKGVNEVASSYMRRDCVSVNTVSDDDRPSHESIVQEYMIAQPEALMSTLMSVINAHMQEEPNTYKVIVFFPTARAAQFHAALARAAGCNCLDLHSRLSQNKRDQAAAAFGSNPTGVMFASDVIARGLDFPDVSLVVQVGLTDATQYEHRVGRTGRAGKTGEALLLLADDESRLLPLLAGMPLKPADPASDTAAGRVLATGGNGVHGSMAWEGLDRAVALVARDQELYKSAEQSFMATLGYLAGKLKQLGWSKAQLVSAVKQRYIGVGLKQAPAIEARTLGKMNLKGVPGIEIAPARQGAGRGGQAQKRAAQSPLR